MGGTRRQNGEGSIFQVSENKWVAKISLGTKPDGSTKIKQFSGKTEAIVKKKLRDFKKSTSFSKKHAPSNLTVHLYFSNWLCNYKYNKLKPSSYDRLESTVVNHIFPSIGGLKIHSVTRDDIQILINQLYNEKKLSFSSVKKVYVALNSCFNHALMDEAMSKNPCVGIVLPSASDRTKQISSLGEEEIKLLKKEVAGLNAEGEPLYYYGYAYLLILNTGLRMGEALSLTWEDVDLKNKTITVSKNSILTKKRDASGNKTGGCELQIQNSTKTSSGNRTIPINQSAMEALLKLKHGNSTEYVISNSRHKSVLPSNFERTFFLILKNAGIEKHYGVHALRHTFASMLFSKGVDVKIVSRLLGHSSVKITYDTYVHLFESDIKGITCVLD